MTLRLLVFDWGDTLMRVFPDADGPMASWPVVEAMPGAAATLEQLVPAYRLAVATNASESGAELVGAALRRVGLDRFLTFILTPQELGARKPEARFFSAVTDKAGVMPKDVAFIGDSYANDIRGAKAAGMHALWYRPAGVSCPESSPEYDGEFSSLADLPEILRRPFVPDLAACDRLLRDAGVSASVRSHSRTVAAVAFRLAEQLRFAGEAVDPLLAHRGGLLHDVGKIAARQTGGSHDVVGGAIVRQAGLSNLATIVERHTAWSVLDGRTCPETWEQRSVYIADRLVDGDRLMGLDARMAAMVSRRPELADRAGLLAPPARQMLADIASRLGMSGDALCDWLIQKGAATTGVDAQPFP